MTFRNWTLSHPKQKHCTSSLWSHCIQPVGNPMGQKIWWWRRGASPMWLDWFSPAWATATDTLSLPPPPPHTFWLGQSFSSTPQIQIRAGTLCFSYTSCSTPNHVWSRMICSPFLLWVCGTGSGCASLLWLGQANAVLAPLTRLGPKDSGMKSLQGIPGHTYCMYCLSLFADWGRYHTTLNLIHISR